MRRKTNIGIIAHIDGGKTTLTERILYYTGRKSKVGEVHEGGATMDYMEEEKKRGITIQSAATKVHWKDQTIYIIDTPGHADFTIEVQRSLRVLTGAILVFDGVAGVECQSETVYNQSKSFKTKVMCFVNKLDRAGSNFWGVVDQIKNKLNSSAIGLIDPIFEDTVFIGFVDLVFQKKYIWSGDKLGQEAVITDVELNEFQLNKRGEIAEAVLEDEELLSYLESGKVSNDLLNKRVINSSLKGKIMPVIGGSAFKNKGVEYLLDKVFDYLPSQEETQEPTSELSAFCFKTAIDPYLGQIVYLKIFGGSIIQGEDLYNSVTEKKERPTKIVEFHASKTTNIKEAHKGDIVGLTGMPSTRTGHTICTKKNIHQLESFSAPKNVIDVELNLKKESQRDILAKAIQNTQFLDPSIHFRYNSGTLIVSAMGELHIEVLINTWMTEYKLELLSSEPKVAYKEKPTTQKQILYTHKKQTGGSGQWAEVDILFEPIEEEEVLFESKLVGVSIPREYVPSIEAGIMNECKKGFKIGSPIIGLKATLLDGRYHSVDSSTLAFEIAARDCLREALKEMNVVILEPIMKLTVYTPTEHLGPVIKDLSSRRSDIVDQTESESNTVLTAHTPVSSLFKYISDLRSLTKGRASQIAEFHQYKQVMPDQEEKIKSNLNLFKK